MVFYRLQVYGAMIQLAVFSSFILMYSSCVFAEYSDADFLVEQSFDLPELGNPLLVAEADSESKQDDAVMSETCRNYAADDDAKVSEIVRGLLR